jgi:hypothetical protein
MEYGWAMSDVRPRPPATSSQPFQESCGVCGGDRRIGNSFGLTTTCPACHGTGRKVETTGFHDVTKTKPSHHRGANKTQVVEKTTWPVTLEGAKLGGEVQSSTACTSETKGKLLREIIDHESTHGLVTQTFAKKVRKQIRPRT